jgi:hypothetical protein
MRLLSREIVAVVTTLSGPRLPTLLSHIVFNFMLLAHVT